MNIHPGAHVSFACTSEISIQILCPAPDLWWILVMFQVGMEGYIENPPTPPFFVRKDFQVSRNPLVKLNFMFDCFQITHRFLRLDSFGSKVKPRLKDKKNFSGLISARHSIELFLLFHCFLFWTKQVGESWFLGWCINITLLNAVINCMHVKDYLELW